MNKQKLKDYSSSINLTTFKVRGIKTNYNTIIYEEDIDGKNIKVFSVENYNVRPLFKYLSNSLQNKNHSGLRRALILLFLDEKFENSEANLNIYDSNIFAPNSSYLQYKGVKIFLKINTNELGIRELGFTNINYKFKESFIDALDDTKKFVNSLDKIFKEIEKKADKIIKRLKKHEKKNSKMAA